MWWRPCSQRLLKHLAPLSTYQDARSIGTSPTCDNTTFHAESKSTHNNWLSLTSQKIFKCIKTDTWKLSLGEGAKRELYLTDGSTGLNLSSPPKKGRLFGKSGASDFVSRIPRNTLLTKALNHYLELNFCRQCIYQWQSRICNTCRLNKLPTVSTLQNSFSKSTWRGSDRQVESDKWLHI